MTSMSLLRNFMIAAWFTVRVLHVILIIRLKCALVRSIHVMSDTKEKDGGSS